MALINKVHDASTVFRRLNGILNIYKPAGIKVGHIKNAVLNSICRDLNEKNNNERVPKILEQPLLESGGATDPLVRKLETLNLADHVSCTGPQYQIKDIRCAVVAALGIHTSGVLLFGINKGLKKSYRIQQNRPIRVYHVTGQLGIATENNFHDSRIILRSKSNHVRPERISALAASIQASQQRKMFEICGVDIQSQAAYEMACKGLIRPANNTIPVIYGIKLIEFNHPEFVLEVHAANESEDYLAALVYEMAIELRTVAHCIGIRCIRHGKFSVENALLRHHWNLDGILRNLSEQNEIIKGHPYMFNQQKIQLHS